MPCATYPSDWIHRFGIFPARPPCCTGRGFATRMLRPTSLHNYVVPNPSGALTQTIVIRQVVRRVATKHVWRFKRKQVTVFANGPSSAVDGRSTAAMPMRVLVSLPWRSAGGALRLLAPAPCPAITSIPATMAAGAASDKTGQPTQRACRARQHTTQTPTQPGGATDALPLGHTAQAPCHTRLVPQPRHYTGTRYPELDMTTYDRGMLLTTKPTFVLCRAFSANLSVSRIVGVSGRHFTNVRLIATRHAFNGTRSHASGTLGLEVTKSTHPVGLA